jgi:hypothetical protein
MDRYLFLPDRVTMLLVEKWLKETVEECTSVARTLSCTSYEVAAVRPEMVCWVVEEGRAEEDHSVSLFLFHCTSYVSCRCSKHREDCFQTTDTLYESDVTERLSGFNG